MTTALEHVRYSCGIAGEEVAEMVDQLEAENARLREELAAAQTDAKRYQWLVVEKSDAADLQMRWDYCYNAWSGCDGADGFTAVIDDAIANGKTE